MFPTGRKIWFYDKDRNAYELEVGTADEKFVTCRRKKKGPSLKIAYEDIRLSPENPIDQELMRFELGGVSAFDRTSEEIEKRVQEQADDEASVEQ